MMEYHKMAKKKLSKKLTKVYKRLAVEADITTVDKFVDYFDPEEQDNG